MGGHPTDCFRFWRPRLAAHVAAVIVGASVVTGPASVNAQDPDLAQIAQKLQLWRSSFVNLRVVHEGWGTKGLKDPEASRPSPEDEYWREEWVWADVGAIRTEEWFFDEGRLKGHEAAGANGSTLRTFQASYGEKAGQPDFLTRLRVGRMSTSAPVSVRNVSPLTYLYAPVTSEWLGDGLARGAATLEGYEDIGGARCARVRIDERAVSSLVWLDPAYDFLVRRVRPNPEKPEGGYVFDVDEFQRVGSIWFPKRGTLGRHGDKPGDEVHWLVTEVAVNLPLDASFFEPPAPQIGTWVSDPDRGIYTFGEKRRGEAREGEIAAQAKENVSEPARPVSAERPLPGAIWWSGLLLLASIVLLVVGICAPFLRRGR